MKIAALQMTPRAVYFYASWIRATAGLRILFQLLSNKSTAIVEMD